MPQSPDGETELEVDRFFQIKETAILKYSKITSFVGSLKLGLGADINM